MRHSIRILLIIICFVCLRFDVGSGMATIRDPNPIKLGEFHTVELYRNHTLGYIIVDGGEPINGSSQVIVSAGMNSDCHTCAF